MSLQDIPPEKRIAFQGEPGAYSNLACREAYPDLHPFPRPTFEDAIAAVREGLASLAMIPIDNSVAGRVADNHHLLPNAGLHIVAEHFQRVNHHLLGLPGTPLESIKFVRSHIQALDQCRDFTNQHGIKRVASADTAGSAREVAELGDPAVAAIASSLAGEIYGLESLAADVEDAEHNTTRFVVLSREPATPDPADSPCMTTFVFQVRNVPAALYKALGGFATNGVNMTKLESYQLGGSFNASQFYADIVGHPADRLVRLAMEELEFFSREVKVLGVYPAKLFTE